MNRRGFLSRLSEFGAIALGVVVARQLVARPAAAVVGYDPGAPEGDVTRIVVAEPYGLAGISTSSYPEWGAVTSTSKRLTADDILRAKKAILEDNGWNRPVFFRHEARMHLVAHQQFLKRNRWVSRA